ncbi:hypothetical protein MMC22_006300 [Lobaria immixta]|nr:hypothetical protein [Lobaria immixta]
MPLDLYERGSYRPTSHRQEPNQEALQGNQTQEIDVSLDRHGNPMYTPAQNGSYLVIPNSPDRHGNPIYTSAQNGSYLFIANTSYPAISSPTPAAPNPRGDKKGPKKTSRTMTSTTGKGKGAIDKSTIPQLLAPLSELTKKYEHIPVKDMEAWSNRPLEDRMLERGKGGHIRRPMNSFMLYRSAYAERCKVWCAQNNHQIVSTICGASWKLESPEIREHYTHCAQVEAENHAKAHPNYSYTPSGWNAPGRKRKRTAPEDEDQEEPSNLDDPEHRPSIVYRPFF